MNQKETRCFYSGFLFFVSSTLAKITTRVIERKTILRFLLYFEEVWNEKRKQFSSGSD